MDLFDAGIMMTCRKTYEVISGEDLIKKVVTWDPNTSRYNKPAKGPKYAFDRFCSADLPVTKAFYDAKSGKGTTARIYMNGEEITGGRAWGHVVGVRFGHRFWHHAELWGWARLVDPHVHWRCTS